MPRMKSRRTCVGMFSWDSAPSARLASAHGGSCVSILLGSTCNLLVWSRISLIRPSQGKMFTACSWANGTSTWKSTSGKQQKAKFKTNHTLSTLSNIYIQVKHQHKAASPCASNCLSHDHSFSFTASWPCPAYIPLLPTKGRCST